MDQREQRYGYKNPVLRAIAPLGEPLAAIIILRYGFRMSWREIATSLAGALRDWARQTTGTV